MSKLILCIMLYIPASVYADTNTDFFDVSGYIGYRHIWSSIGAAPIYSFPEVGLLLNFIPNDNWSTYTQFNINKNSVNNSMEHSIIYGFLSYQNSIGNIPFRVNIGKLRHEFGLYNANIVNPSTRPAGVIAPQSIYWNNLSSTLISGYGIHFEFFLSDFKFGYTIDQHIIVDGKKDSLMWTGVPFIEMKPYFGSHQIYNINYEPINSRIKIKTAFTKLKLNKSFSSIEFITTGIEYSNDEFTASAETVVVRGGTIEWSDLNDLRYGFSLYLEYYINDDIEIHTNFNMYEDRELDKKFKGAVPGASKWKDLSIGITKHYGQLEFKADIHKVYGGRTLLSENWNNPDIADWWYIGTSIVYHF